MTRRNKTALIYVAVLLAIAVALLCSAKAVLLVERSDEELLACVIYQEAGGDECSDLARYMVGDVVLNRVNDPRFPDTIEAVLTQPGQYMTYSETGVVWKARAFRPEEKEAVARAYAVARDLLNGNHSPLYGAGYIWQSDVEQGVDNIEESGIIFGRGDSWRP